VFAMVAVITVDTVAAFVRFVCMLLADDGVLVCA
jgi:hypothetical protein